MGERAIEAVLGIDQITIAAWNGAAMGGGPVWQPPATFVSAATIASCNTRKLILALI